jgi:CHAT domain-containing protein
MTASRREGTALLGFHVCEHETLLIWADETSAEPEVERATVTAEQIADATRRLHDLFSPGNINFRRPEQTTDLAWLAPLGHALLAPVAKRLQNSSHLVVSPHSELHSLPLQLLAPSGGVPLGTSHSICYVPNFSLYTTLLKRTGVDAARLTLPSLCLAAAAAEDSKRVADDFVVAPRAFAEATGGTLQHGLEATGKAFRAQASSAAILYLSSHGRFDRTDSLQSCLLLSDGHTLPSRVAGIDRGHALSVSDILGVSIVSPLVILDACMSGIQRLASGDELTGFPTAFLLSGAGAVIASTWSVEQNLARDFMLALFTAWSSGGSLGNAMRHAVVTSQKQYPHPFHWAVFSLFGNDQLLFPKGEAK